jgi:hypothetical protein
MALLTGLTCASKARNTGTNLCAIDLDRLAGFALVPKGVSFTPTQTATGAAFFTALQAAAYNVNPALRIYPFMGINGIEDATTAATTETSGYGDVRTLLDAKAGFNLIYWGKGSCWNKNAMAFSRQEASYTMILWDVNGIVAGTELTNGNLTGFDLNNFYVNARTLNTGAAGVQIVINVSFRDWYNQFGKNWAYVQTDSASQLMGLNDIYLKNITSTVLPTPAAGTYYIQVLSSCGGTSVAAIYNAELDTITQGAPFSTTNPATGNAISILTNTYSATYDAMVIGLDTSDADYIAATQIKVALADTSVLAGLGIIGFEAVPNSITFAK